MTDSFSTKFGSNTPDGVPSHMVAVGIEGLSMDGLLPRFLGNALTNALGRAGLEFQDHSVLPLERCNIYVLEVQDRGAAIDCLRTELLALNAIDSSWMAWLDCDENIWRPVFPLGPFDPNLLIDQAIQRVQTVTASLLEKVNELLKEHYNGIDGQ